MERHVPSREAAKIVYIKYIADIDSRLEHDTIFVKEGHRVRGLNPDGGALEVPLTERKKRVLEWNRDVLRHKLTRLNYGGSRNHDILPRELQMRNPQRRSK
mgnify:CR=1 FL=1